VGGLPGCVWADAVMAFLVESRGRSTRCLVFGVALEDGLVFDLVVLGVEVMVPEREFTSGGAFASVR
jgi:hypothetical protein